MIVTFGEALLRFSTPTPMLLSQSIGRELDFFVGGSELNVALACQAQGLPARWVSALPDREVGDLALHWIRGHGIDTTHVSRGPGRMAYYLLETGASPRPSRVLERQTGILGESLDLARGIDWRTALSGASWFHTSGITAGLSTACRAAITNAMQTARSNGIPVSYDFNFRRRIWSLDQARAGQLPLLEHVDVLFCSAADITGLLEVKLPPRNSDGYFDSVRAAFAPYKIQTIVLSERDSEHTYRVVVLDQDAAAISRTLDLDVVDRIGAGDAMTAGFLRARLEERDLQAQADFAAFCGALKHSVPGDFLPLGRHEVDAMFTSGGSLQR